MAGLRVTLLLAMVLTWATAAHAQITNEAGDFSLQRLKPSAGPDSVLGVESGRVGPAGQAAGSVWMQYQNDPLVAIGRPDPMQDDDEVLGSLVKHRVELDLLLSYNLHERVMVFAGAQAILTQNRDRRIDGIDGTLVDLESTGFGGIDLGGKIQLLDGPLDLALLPAVTLYPAAHNYFGESGPVWRPAVSLSKRLGRFTTAFEVTYLIRKRARVLDLVVDDEVEYNAGVAYRISESPTLGIDLQGALAGGFAVDAPFQQASRTPLEAMAGLRLSISSTHELLAGAGMGFTRAFGTPAVRAFAGYRLSYGFIKPAPVPVEVEPPLQLAEPSPVPAPIPVEPTPAPPAPEPPPADGDGDGLSDNVDQCPAEAGVAEHGGCPPLMATLVEDKIEITERVDFASGKAEVAGSSHALLDQVVTVLKANPEVSIRIEGHTDNRGPEPFNRKLSQQRADAVRDYVVERGIETSRIEARGFGSSRPIDTNDTEAGRATNRRVEFVVKH